MVETVLSLYMFRDSCDGVCRAQSSTKHAPLTPRSDSGDHDLARVTKAGIDFVNQLGAVVVVDSPEHNIDTLEINP